MSKTLTLCYNALWENKGFRNVINQVKVKIDLTTTFNIVLSQKFKFIHKPIDLPALKQNYDGEHSKHQHCNCEDVSLLILAFSTKQCCAQIQMFRQLGKIIKSGLSTRHNVFTTLIFDQNHNLYNLNKSALVASLSP